MGASRPVRPIIREFMFICVCARDLRKRRRAHQAGAFGLRYSDFFRTSVFGLPPCPFVIVRAIYLNIGRTGRAKPAGLPSPRVATRGFFPRSAEHRSAGRKGCGQDQAATALAPAAPSHNDHNRTLGRVPTIGNTDFRSSDFIRAHQCLSAVKENSCPFVSTLLVSAFPLIAFDCGHSFASSRLCCSKICVHLCSSVVKNRFSAPDLACF